MFKNLFRQTPNSISYKMFFLGPQWFGGETARELEEGRCVGEQAAEQIVLLSSFLWKQAFYQMN